MRWKYFASCSLTLAIACCCIHHVAAKGVELSSECDANKKCDVPGATCTFGRCRCDSSHIEHDKRCLPIASKILAPCEIPEQCRDLLNADCFEDVCQCKREYVQTSRTECRMPCEDSSSCDINFECINGFCKCPRDKVERGNACYIKIGTLGASCDTRKFELCWDEEDQDSTMKCQYGKCVCRLFYKPDDRMERCVADGPLISLAALTVALLGGLFYISHKFNHFGLLNKEEKHIENKNDEASKLFDIENSIKEKRD